MDITLGVFPTCCSHFAPKSSLGSQEEAQNNWIEKMILLIISVDELIKANLQLRALGQELRLRLFQITELKQDSGKVKHGTFSLEKSLSFLLSYPSKLQEGKTDSGLRTKTLQVLADFTSVSGLSDKCFGKAGGACGCCPEEPVSAVRLLRPEGDGVEGGSAGGTAVTSIAALVQGYQHGEVGVESLPPSFEWNYLKTS
ncbi:hypothetical protein EK904_001858, partial [Melospiza melodia maxima]